MNLIIYLIKTEHSSQTQTQTLLIYYSYQYTLQNYTNIIKIMILIIIKILDIMIIIMCIYKFKHDIYDKIINFLYKKFLISLYIIILFGVMLSLI